MIRRAIRAGAALSCLLAVLAPCSAASTRRWTETPADLAGGHAEGMAVSREGRLFLAPRVSRVGGLAGAIEPAQIWSMAADGAGNLYLGTGPEGHVLRIDAAGRSRVFFDADEPLATALALTRDGAVLVGTAPEGKVYRVGPDGVGTLFSETGERYVWSLTVGPDGQVFAGTGERGKILRLAPSGAAAVVFDADEPHIMSLLSLPDGDLLAGGSGRGLVYRIDRDEHALVLHDDELPEVVALAADADGSVLAALVAPPQPEVRLPALQLRLPDGAPVGSGAEAIGPLEPGSGPMLRGVIEGFPLPPGAEREQRRGRIVRIHDEGVREIWSSADEAPFCLLRGADGRVLFGTGEPGRLYRVEAQDEVALLATLAEAQVTGLLAAGGQVFLATSNPAAAYRIDDGARDTGEFVSRPFDAGGPTRWGAIHWRVDNPAGRTEIYTRTGNSRDPDATWSAWSPVLTDPSNSTIVNPEGRYLQWRVRQAGGSSAGPRISGVGVRYEPFNRSPRLRDLRTDPVREAVSGPATFRWSLLDPDGDDVDVVLQVRLAGAATWNDAAKTVAAVPEEVTDAWREDQLVWDTAEAAEGDYEVRVVASDQRANAEGEGQVATLDLGPMLIVDRTGPELEIVTRAGGVLELRASDAHSRLRSVTVMQGDEARYAPRPLDGLCDSRREVYSLRLPAGTDPAGWSVRGEDAAGNRTDRSLAASRTAP